MEEETDDLEWNRTWNLTKFLVGKHPARCKWVFTHKILMTILLAIKHGLLQRALDKSREMTILRPLWRLLNLMQVIISIATNFGWTKCQLDIKMHLFKVILSEESTDLNIQGLLDMGRNIKFASYEKHCTVLNKHLMHVLRNSVVHSCKLHIFNVARVRLYFICDM